LKDKVIAVYGSGFGLYGYVPALLESGIERIALLDRYSEKFYARSELSRYAKRVDWQTSNSLILERADGAVVSLSPYQQPGVVYACLKRSNIRYLLLEKPMAPTPQESMVLLNALIESNKCFRIGYNFRFTSWAERIVSLLKTWRGKGEVSIFWSFHAHHFRNNIDSWKRYDSLGGGAIRFYGIHLIALMSELGYTNVDSSFAYRVNGQTYKWIAVFSKISFPNIRISLDTKSDTSVFSVKSHNADGEICSLAELEDPFSCDLARESNEEGDRRIPILKKVCMSLFSPSSSENSWYKATINLWEAAESMAVYSK